MSVLFQTFRYGEAIAAYFAFKRLFSTVCFYMSIEVMFFVEAFSTFITLESLLSVGVHSVLVMFKSCSQREAHATCGTLERFLTSVEE